MPRAARCDDAPAAAAWRSVPGKPASFGAELVGRCLTGPTRCAMAIDFAVASRLLEDTRAPERRVAPRRGSGPPPPGGPLYPAAVTPSARQPLSYVRGPGIGHQFVGVGEEFPLVAPYR